jgi:hypothetical protein
VNPDASAKAPWTSTAVGNVAVLIGVIGLATWTAAIWR